MTTAQKILAYYGICLVEIITCLVLLCGKNSPTYELYKLTLTEWYHYLGFITLAVFFQLAVEWLINYLFGMDTAWNHIAEIRKKDDTDPSEGVLMVSRLAIFVVLVGMTTPLLGWGYKVLTLDSNDKVRIKIANLEILDQNLGAKLEKTTKSDQILETEYNAEVKAVKEQKGSDSISEIQKDVMKKRLMLIQKVIAYRDYLGKEKAVIGGSIWEVKYLIAHARIDRVLIDNNGGDDRKAKELIAQVNEAIERYAPNAEQMELPAEFQNTKTIEQIWHEDVLGGTRAAEAPVAQQ